MILFLYYYHVFLSWIKNLLSNKRQTTKAVCLLTEWNRWGGNPTSLLRPLGRDGCLFRPQIPFGIVYSFNNLIIQYIILMSSILRFAPFPETGLRHLPGRVFDTCSTLKSLQAAEMRCFFIKFYPSSVVVLWKFRRFQIPQYVSNRSYIQKSLILSQNLMSLQGIFYWNFFDILYNRWSRGIAGICKG